MDRVVIVGAGVVGLASALFLARRGHDVVVLDRDDPPPDGTPDDDFAAWARPGVAQAVHSHAFLARSARVLREEAPDVLAALSARGVTTAAINFGQGYEEDVALFSRRLVFEAVLRRLVEAEPGVVVRSGVHVAGLLADPAAARATVRGVRVRDGERLPARLVVDCAGRRSLAPRWLREIGAAAPAEERHPCHVVYFTRHYRLRSGQSYPSEAVPLARVTPYGPFIIFGGDNRTFSLAVALSTQDPLRAALREGKVLDRVFAAMPGMDEWIDAGEPITDVHLMAGLANRRRCLVRDGAPVVDGYVLVGDSSIYTNATLGQGLSLGLWQAQRLARLCDGLGDPAGAALMTDLEQWTGRTLGPRFAMQAAGDERQSSLLRDGVRGAPMPEPDPERRPLFALMALAAQGDEVAAGAYRRVGHLLADPAEVFAAAGLTERISAFLDTDPSFGGGPGPLPRADFEAVVS